MTSKEIIKENLTKAAHDVHFLRKDLLEVHNNAAESENDALCVLMLQLIVKANEIDAVLSQLKKV